MTETRRLPVGIEEFREIRQNHFYYVDKTGLIEELLDQGGKVNLFTRPRRFGKTLNMSMLKNYLEIGADPALFEGLRIAQRTDLCDAHMGKYPVVFVSLKSVDGLTYDLARYRLAELVGDEAGRFRCLLDSDRLSEEDKNRYRSLIAVDEGNYSMNDKTLISSLHLLCRLLSQHYGQNAILLIDEYDVPLDKALQNGYYREMVSLIRAFLEKALKTNSHLHMAVLTGCLRVTKESIFTGLNNLKVLSIVDVRFDEWFGFTDTEVRQLLADYGLSDHLDEMREWYDGYRFGNTDVYCPWDVINHVDLLRADPQAEPQAYWINTSGNALVKRFVDKADKTTRDEMEQLIAGDYIEKRIRLELTYDEIDRSIDNLWSVLYTTGYLTQMGRAVGGVYQLVIPNREVREVFVDQIQEWFRETICKEYEPLRELSQALLDGDAQTLEQQLNAILGRTISIQDTRARTGQKENYYHGFLLGLLRSNAQWLLRSNAEAGDGFSDIIVEPEDPDAGIVIEIKYAPTFQGLDAACAAALEQIRERRYAEHLANDGRIHVLAYGIAFNKKRCRVAVMQVS